MKTIAKIKLLTDEIGAKTLLHTMETFNSACDEIAKTCFKEGSGSKFNIQTIVYHNIKKKYGLSAQLVIRAIAKACEAYKLNKKVCPTFKPHGSICYDQRILSFKFKQLTPSVSLTTVEGRKSFNIEVRDYFQPRLDRVAGQVDLVYCNGQFWLYATTDMPDGTPIKNKDVLGVDLGIVQIATTSDNETFSGKTIENKRQKYQKQREQCQKKATKQAKRKLRKVSGSEKRFRTDVNHCISKKLVAKAKDTYRIIALEDLTGINDRKTVRKSQRAKHHSWAFYQLRKFIEYKAKLAGVSVVLVDPRNTSRGCSACGHIAKENRKSQAEFCCIQCGHNENADYNAAKNIRSRGVSTALLSSALQPLKAA